LVCARDVRVRVATEKTAKNILLTRILLIVFTVEGEPTEKMGPMKPA
jgi:hypothetical protein